MRILILHMRYHPDATGTGPLVTQLARDLSAKGEQVVVITSVPHYGSDAIPSAYRRRVFHRSSEQGVTVWRTAAYASARETPLRRGVDYALYTALSAALGLLCGAQDVVLCVSPPVTVGLAGWWVARLRGARMIFNAQDIWPDGLVRMGKLRNRALIALARAVERAVYRFAHRVTVVSEGMKDNLLAKGVPASKIEVIPNWVDLQAIRPMDKGNAFRKRHALLDRFVVLFAGNIGYAAGLHTVLEAAERLRSHEEIVFLIVGEGSAKAELVERAADLRLPNVRFLGTQPLDVLSPMLGAADVSLVTLRRGMGDLSVPSKTYAIMASGRPVVAAVPADSEVVRLVEEARCGSCLPPEDPVALAEVILTYLGDEGRQAAEGARGRRYVEAHNARSAIVERYHALLQGAAAG